MNSGGIDGVLTAAQELKVPLTELRQMVLALGELTPADERLRTEMVAVSDRALRQVNDLAKMQKLNGHVYEMEPIAIRAACDEVLREFDVEINYNNKTRLVSANRELLQSVIYNFVLNAMQYSDNETRVAVRVCDAQDAVRVDVRDFGPYLPKDTWREIKKGFLAHPEAIAMRPGSSALGLYIATKFSEYMHATVGAVRHRDGTSFYVNLPVSRQMTLWELV